MLDKKVIYSFRHVNNRELKGDINKEKQKGPK